MPNVIAYNYAIVTFDTNEENVNTCKEFLMNKWNGDYSDAHDGYQSYCEGTGTVSGGYSLKADISSGELSDEQIQLLSVVVSYEFETRYYELNKSEESVNSCKETVLNSPRGEEFIDNEERLQNYCEGAKDGDGYSILDDIRDGSISVDSLVENNVLTQLETAPSTIEITDYDETCGSEVVILAYIEGLSVTRIGESAFENKNITTIEWQNKKCDDITTTEW